MTKRQLNEAVEGRNSEVKEILQTVINAITAKGQRKKLAENPEVKSLLDFYGVDISE